MDTLITLLKMRTILTNKIIGYLTSSQFPRDGFFLCNIYHQAKTSTSSFMSKLFNEDNTNDIIFDLREELFREECPLFTLQNAQNYKANSENNIIDGWWPEDDYKNRLDFLNWLIEQEVISLKPSFETTLSNKIIEITTKKVIDFYFDTELKHFEETFSDYMIYSANDTFEQLLTTMNNIPKARTHIFYYLLILKIKLDNQHNT